MVQPQYTAGFQFIVSTPSEKLDKHHRKTIRGHATRAGRPTRQAVKLSSWISPERRLDSTLNPPSPGQVGAAFSGLQLPPGVEPYMIQELVKLIDLSKHGVYPYDICLNVHIVERGWFPYMISDICCLHSMMFSVKAFVENAPGGQLSHSASLHYARTLQLLQARLNEPDQTAAISDSTIMVVVTLAAAAEITGDAEAVANHARGLDTIVGLRGGVRALTTHNNLQVKVCRADLAHALLSGQRPRLFREGIPWDCFIADRNLIGCDHQTYDASIHHLMKAALKQKLHNAFRDIHAFSCLSNLAYQTTRKFSPITYNEMMISILYRLTHLTFEIGSLQETIRTGLLTFCSTIFMQRSFIEQPYYRLVNLYDDSLFMLRISTDAELPLSMILWLVFLTHVVAPNQPTPEDWRAIWLDETLNRANISSWSQARDTLRSIMWVDFVHDRLGKQVFDAAMLRLGESMPASVHDNSIRDSTLFPL